MGLVKGLSVAEKSIARPDFMPQRFLDTGLCSGVDVRGRGLFQKEKLHKDVWFRINLYGEDCGFITLEGNQTESALLF